MTNKDNKNTEIKLQADMIGLLTIQANSTQKDPVAFLDEIIQNADRAGAKNVRVVVDSPMTRITVYNDGGVLEDPQVLFSMAESKWDDKVMEEESPFGMGFFSNLSVSGQITVESGDTRIVLDRDKAIQERVLSVPSMKMDEEDYVDGFIIKLDNLDKNKISRWSVISRVELLGKYVHNMDIYLNDDLVEKKNITDTNGAKYAVVVPENELFEGWVEVCSSFFNHPKVFNKGRFVMNLESMYYMGGEIHLKPGALNLVAPDRKSAINDDKLKRLLEKLKGMASAICLEILQKGSNSDIEEYAGAIKDLVDAREAQKVTQFQVFVGGNEKEMDLLDKIIKKASDKDQGFGQYETDSEAFLSDAEQAQENMEINIHMKDDEPYDTIGSSRSSSSSVIHHEGKKPKFRESLQKKSLMNIIDGEALVFWVEESDIIKYDRQIRILKYYNLPLIVGRNDVDQYLIKDAESDNLLHLSKLKETVNTVASLSNRTLSGKEFRAHMLLDMASRLMGFKENMFEIGDLMVVVKTKVDHIEDSEYEKIDEEAIAILNNEGNVVWMDRTLLKIDMLEDSEDQNLSIFDYKFIMANLKTLSREVSRLDISTKSSTEDTVNFYEKKILHGLAFN